MIEGSKFLVREKQDFFFVTSVTIEIKREGIERGGRGLPRSPINGVMENFYVSLMEKFEYRNIKRLRIQNNS